MKQTQSTASFEPNLSEETSASLLRNVIINENSIQPRKKSLFEFEPFFLKKKLSLRATSSTQVHQSKGLQEQVFFLPSSKKSLDRELTEDHFKLCPLIPNGAWVHIPYNWLSMMASVVEIINRAIKEDDIEIIYQLKDTQKEFYNQLVNSIPNTSIPKESTELNKIDNCMEILTSQISAISDLLFHDEKDDLSSLSHKAENSHEWFIPSVAKNSLYFDATEVTPFNDLLEFMMNLPTVVRKSKVLLSSDNLLTEKDVGNENFDLSDSISVRELIETQDVEIKEQAFHGLLESNLEYGVLFNDQDVHVNQEAMELAEFNIKYVNTSRISDFLSSKEEISALESNDKGGERNEDKDEFFSKKGSVNSIHMIELNVFKIGDNRKNNERKIDKDENDSVESEFRNKFEKTVSVKKSIKKGMGQSISKDLKLNDHIFGRISYHKTSSTRKSNKTWKRRYKSRVNRSSLGTSLISKRFLDSIKPGQLYMANLRSGRCNLSVEKYSTKNSLNRNLILEEIVEQSEQYFQSFVNADKSQFQMFKYKNMTAHSNFLEKQAKNIRIILQYKFAKMGIFNINTGKGNHELQKTWKNSEMEPNIFTKSHWKKKKAHSNAPRPIFGCSPDKICDNNPKKNTIMKLKSTKMHQVNSCVNMDMLLSTKVSFTRKGRGLSHRVEDQYANFFKMKPEYKVIKEKHHHLYNPRINPSSMKVTRKKTLSVTLDINTIVGNLSNSRRLFNQTRSHSFCSVESLSRD